MNKVLGTMGVAALCAVSFAAGHVLQSGGDATPPPTVEVARESDWRIQLKEAREQSDAQSARHRALEMLNEAESDVALRKSVLLLGALATDEDIPLLESLARSREPSLTFPAIEALGLVGGDAAMAILIDLTRRDETRSFAFIALGTTGDDRVIDHLRPALGDPAHVAAATQGLQMLGSVDAETVLLEGFESSGGWEASLFAEAIVKLPPERERARDVLRKVARRSGDLKQDAATMALAAAKDPEIHALLLTQARFGKETAIRQLALLNDDAAVETLRSLLNGGTAIPAVDALGQMSHPDAQPILTEALVDQPRLAQHILYQIRDITEPDTLEAVMDLARNGPEPARSGAAGRLYLEPWKKAPPPAEVLTLARGELDAQTTAKQQALSFLLTHGTPNDTKTVRDAILNGSQQTRMEAVWALQSIKSPLSGELILLLCEDPDPNVAYQAVYAAANRPDTNAQAVQMALERLQGGDIDHFGQMAIEFAKDDAVPMLQAMVLDGTRSQKMSATQALINSRDLDIIQDLVERSDSMEPEVRAQVLQHALYSQTMDPGELADRALATKDPSLQYVAVDALASSGTKASRARLLKLSYEDDTKVAALNAIARVAGPEEQARLIEALDDPETAPTALGGLGMIQTESAVAAMADAARTSDSPDTRAQALYSLMNARPSDSQDLFLEALEDDNPQVRGAAIEGLGHLSTDEASEALMGMLDGPDGLTAAHVLQRSGSQVYRDNQERIDAEVEAEYARFLPDDLDELPQ